MKTPRVIVIGAGIGGLATAAALRGAGMETEVFEQAPELKPVGAGIALWSNALHALRKLGFTGELPAYREPLEAAIRTWDGRILTRTSSEHLEKKFGEINVVIHRSELQDVLWNLAGGNVHLGKTLAGWESKDERIVARFTDGSEVVGDVLIGADGLHSVVRAKLHPGESLRYSGYTAWRGITHFDPKRLRPAETWGTGARFGQAPISGGRVYWFATANVPAGQRSPDGEKAELLRRFAGWHDPIEDLIRSTPDEAVLRHDISDRAPIKSWGSGRVTLLGDAAHPTTPNLGQGGCMAIEDAVVLRDCLTGASDLTAALREYERRRMPRTASLVNRAWNVGRVGQLANPVAVALRNTLFKAFAPLVQDRELAGIIGYRV